MTILRPCAEVACPEPATYRGRCEAHARRRNREITSVNKPLYNSKKWKLLRRRQLFNHPLCKCGAIASDVDHIQPIEDGGDPWSFANLQSLCHACHARKSRLERAA